MYQISIVHTAPAHQPLFRTNNDAFDRQSNSHWQHCPSLWYRCSTWSEQVLSHHKKCDKRSADRRMYLLLSDFKTLSCTLVEGGRETKKSKRWRLALKTCAHVTISLSIHQLCIQKYIMCTTSQHFTTSSKINSRVLQKFDLFLATSTWSSPDISPRMTVCNLLLIDLCLYSPPTASSCCYPDIDEQFF